MAYRLGCAGLRGKGFGGKPGVGDGDEGGKKRGRSKRRELTLVRRKLGDKRTVVRGLDFAKEGWRKFTYKD